MLSVQQQTECEDHIRTFLQSIAILAVQAQDEIGKIDVCLDTLELITSDLERCQKFANALATDDERGL